MTEKLRDLSLIDVSLLESTVAASRLSGTASREQKAAADQILQELEDNPDTWLQAVHILQNAQTLNTSDFQRIHELCLFVFSTSQGTELIQSTLATLHGFLSWIPLGYIFESPLLGTLLKFFPVASYRDLTLRCLTVVAALQSGNFYDVHYAKMYTNFMVQLQGILPSEINIPDASANSFFEDQTFIENLASIFTSFYKDILPSGTNIPDAYANPFFEEQTFIENLALFFTSFSKSHIRILESTAENKTALLLGLEYLIGISYVEDTVVFKVCLDYWNLLVRELYVGNPAASSGMMGFQGPLIPGMIDGLGPALAQRRQLYSLTLSKLRMLMISRMAKPEVVLIVEDENSNVVREQVEDDDVLVQYKIMKETLIYLSYLDHEDTERQMLKKLSKQLTGEKWTWNNLNTLCWAIGSISGSMMGDSDNRFLVNVMNDLLKLCEITEGKENKAVVASNIMYVVGRCPRLLSAPWMFLKTVVNKLFEFMHETHPGVQDLACGTFLKIVQKCKREFVITQVGENEPFVSELLNDLPVTVRGLEPHQIHTFFESVGHMIQAESEATRRDDYRTRLMGLPNMKWAEIIGQACQRGDILKEPDVIGSVLNILQTNTSVAISLGTFFFPQMSFIFSDTLMVYRIYSELISHNMAEGGIVDLLRSVKPATLKLLEIFLDKDEEQPNICKQFVPLVMDVVLCDYARNLPDARESEVLSLFATIINKYEAIMMDYVPHIFEVVFECTLEMITKNFEDYPEHRLKFFSLLRAIATHCFQALYQLSSQQLKLVMDSVIWAFRHTERNIAETGLILLLEMLKNFQVSGFCNQFHRTYFLTIEQEIFAVLTDTFHKPGFKLHVLILQHLFCLVDSGSLTEPLWDASTVSYPYPNNMVFVREYTIKLLGSSFPNMTSVEVTQVVDGLFTSKSDFPTFKNHIRDFLIQSKEFSAQDNKDLYAEEAAAQIERERQWMLSIPGLIAPSELHDEMVDS